MKRLRIVGIASLALLGMCLMGCASTGAHPGRTITDYAGDIERFTELAASVALLRDDVKELKEPVCAAVAEAVAVLENIDDPDATFDAMRFAALNAIKDFEHEKFTPGIRNVTVLVVDQILNAAYDRVEGRFADLLERADAVLVIGKSVANGLNNACASAMSISTFGIEDE